jgi:hypothetical protein
MKVIITESQYKKILLEQSNVYTDEAKYKKALKVYNKKMVVYQMSLELYKERADWSKNYSVFNPAFNTPNMKKLEKLTGSASINIPYDMDVYYRCKNNLPNDNGYKMTNCDNGSFEYKNLGSPEIDKWYKVPTANESGDFNQNMWLPIFKKPNILKPIFKKPEPPKSVQPTVTKPSIVQPPKAKPSLPLSTLDKTKPVDFYFGNRILRAPDYEIAKKFAEKLALRNFNSNQVFVYKDKNNEKWFIGANDKIYFSQDSYNQDPNKNVYVDPVKMGVAFI